MENKPMRLKLLIGAVVIVLAAVIPAFRPRTSLFEYAMTLDEGLLACGRGSVWNTVGELENGYLQVERLGEAEVRKYTKPHAYPEPARMNAWEMAECFVYTFVRSDGSVWAAVDAEAVDDILELRPFAMPAAEYEDTGKLWLMGFSGYGSGRNGYSLKATAQLESMEDVSDAEVLLAAKFKDGWHYICSAGEPPWSDPSWSKDEMLLRRIDMQGTVPMYDMELYFGRCYFDTAEYNNIFNIQFRIDILHKESGELIAAKNLSAENRHTYISAHRQYYNYTD